MALQPSIRVINGRVFGAYAAQAKNVAYGQGTVEDALDELTDDSGYTVINSNISYRKIGRLVETLIFIPSTAASSWTTLGNLPSDCAPGTSIYDCPFVSGSTRAIFYISEAGNVKYQNNSGSSIAAVKTFIANVATQ